MSLPSRLLRLAPRASLRPYTPIRTLASGVDRTPPPNGVNPRPVPANASRGPRNAPFTAREPHVVDRPDPVSRQMEIKEETSDYIMDFKKDADDDEFDDFQFDDLTSIGHSNLDLHREARQYARLAAYEMPLLAKLKTEFVPPTEKQCLRFRYTSYMGEMHPAEKKVVVEAHVEDLPLSERERIKFMKIAGPRVDERGVLRMSCERFEHQAQNKRFLADKVEELIAEAKNTADMFEDIPLDTRHIKAEKKNPKPQFPEEWRLTPERRQQLENERLQKERELYAELVAIKEAEQAAIKDALDRAQAAAKAPPMPAAPARPGARA